MPEDSGLLLGTGGAAPDVGDSQLADVAVVWRECQNGRTGRRRAQTSVTSLYSSGRPLLLCTPVPCASNIFHQDPSRISICK